MGPAGPAPGGGAAGSERSWPKVAALSCTRATTRRSTSRSVSSAMMPSASRARMSAEYSSGLALRGTQAGGAMRGHAVQRGRGRPAGGRRHAGGLHGTPKAAARVWATDGKRVRCTHAGATDKALATHALGTQHAACASGTPSQHSLELRFRDPFPIVYPL